MNELRCLGLLLLLAGCSPEEPALQDIPPWELPDSVLPAVFVLESEAEDCELGFRFTEDREVFATAIRRAREVAFQLEADAILIESTFRDQEGVNSYILSGVALYCEGEEE